MVTVWSRYMAVDIGRFHDRGLGASYIQKVHLLANVEVDVHVNHGLFLTTQG